jgi:predicted HicB family RNase H-like nuclease
MSIDLPEQEHKKIKVRAAREGISIREFVIECIFSRMVKDQYQDRKNPQDEEDFF